MTHIPLTDVQTLKHILAQTRTPPSRSMGQHFLISPEVIDAIIAVASEGPHAITELGPGIGAITQGLAMNDMRVRAIEKDDDFARLLPKHIPPKYRNNIETIHADMKDVSWEWDEPYQLVGNIPYNLSGLIVRRATQLYPAPKCVILLVQKEVGQRICETPPDMSLLSLAVSLWGRAQMVLHVPAHCFWPQPRVASLLVSITPHNDDEAISTEERESILSLAKPFFQAKRKQIGGVLKRTFDMSEQEAASILERAGVSASARPQELSPHTWTVLRRTIEA